MKQQKKKKKVLNFSGFFKFCSDPKPGMKCDITCKFYSLANGLLWTYLQQIISSINSKNMGSWS